MRTHVLEVYLFSTACFTGCFLPTYLITPNLVILVQHYGIVISGNIRCLAFRLSTSVEIIGSDTDPWVTYDFLLVIHHSVAR